MCTSLSEDMTVTFYNGQSGDPEIKKLPVREVDIKFALEGLFFY